MERLVYLSVRVGCAAYLLYKGKHSINSPFHSKNVILLL